MMKTSLSPRCSPATTSSSSMPTVSNNNITSSEHGQEDNNDGQVKVIISCTNEDKVHQLTTPTARDRPNAPVANALEHDDKRPHAPVAKLLLHENERKQRQEPFHSDDTTDASFLVAPPPQSPNNNALAHHSMPSPPTIVSSPNLTSPHIPAAPPTTPYSPFAASANQRVFPTVPTFAAPNLNNGPPEPSTTTCSSTSSFNSSSSSSSNDPNKIITTLLTSPTHNPFTSNPQTTHLLRTHLLQTHSIESTRINSHTTHETSNYTSITEYRHALARERRHSLSLAIQLAHYKFLSKYQSCSLYSNLEMSEEGRMNRILKNIDCMKKDMEEEKIRCVMELEREEEGIVNGLMGRLEDVRREKRMLEERVYSGSGGDEFERMVKMMEEQKKQQQYEQQYEQQGQQEQRGVSNLVGTFGRMQVDAQDTTTKCTGSNTGESNGASSCNTKPTPSTPSAIDVFPCLKEDDDEEEEEEEDFNDDILGERHHDAEMEEELEKMLKMKESKKKESG